MVVFMIQSLLGSRNKTTDIQVSQQSVNTQTTQAVEQTQPQIVTGEIVFTNPDGSLIENTQGITGVNGQQVETDANGLVIVNNNQQQTIPPTTANPVFTTVDESYLSDALFIGDSRTVALQMYGGLVNTNFFVDTGMSIWKVMDAPIANINGQTMTVDAALQSASFNKVYIMLGINEVGTGTADTFLQQYANVVNRIRQLQPQAIIYVQSIMHVTQSKDEAGTDINNVNINERNEKLKTLADNVNVFWIDENEAFDFVSDQVHNHMGYMYVAYYQTRTSWRGRNFRWAYRDIVGIVCPYNIKSLLKDTELRYSQLDKFILKKNDYLDFIKYFRFPKHRITSSPASSPL
mgnify:CR=1 FL=1